MRQWRWIAASMIAVAISACGGSSSSGYSTGPNTQPNPGTGGPPANTNEITLLNQSFSPNAITIPVGTTVTWMWQACDASGGGGYGSGNACVTHNVTFDDGSNIASATQSSGTFTRNFTTAGVFKYHCGIHGAAIMSGQVTVQ
jgi:plastocyanin